MEQAQTSILEQLATTLCYDDRPAVVRAVALFILKIYAVGEPAFPVSWRRAKVFAALALLEHLDSVSDEPFKLGDRLHTPGYSDLLKFTIGSGWGRVRRTGSADSYLDYYSSRVSNAAVIAEMAEFSYRYVMAGFNDRTAGFTLARDFITAKYKTTAGYSRSSITNRWASYQHGSTAVLIYLMTHPTIGLLTADVDDASFSDLLLKEVEDREKLMRLFAGYIAITDKLRRHGYDDERINIPALKKMSRSASFPAGDFSEEDKSIVSVLRSAECSGPSLSAF